MAWRENRANNRSWFPNSPSFFCLSPHCFVSFMTPPFVKFHFLFWFFFVILFLACQKGEQKAGALIESTRSQKAQAAAARGSPAARGRLALTVTGTVTGTVTFAVTLDWAQVIRLGSGVPECQSTRVPESITNCFPLSLCLTIPARVLATLRQPGASPPKAQSLCLGQAKKQNKKYTKIRGDQSGNGWQPPLKLPSFWGKY